MNATANNDTKERILDAAVGIVLEKGFSGVGINEILKAVNVPKGSFYHWFTSKEQFGVELLKYFGGKAQAYTRKWLTKTDTIPNAYERLVAFYEARLSMTLEQDCQQGCLVSKLTAEVSSWSDAMRAEVSANYDAAISLLRRVIEEGQAQGSIRQSLDAGHTASIIHDVWLGAYLRGTAGKQVQPLREALQFVKSYLPANR
ncbi:TetR/AcrR family transcriptional regulator [Brevifollis gellanilyticus]|uniref:TetR family transcriptional regulator n=1 Tax=Brevifollis gellanilyticus TaxID=748831 RepID=A0A512M485_9BACT|nr:TetR/AcrR family transcriptional regulator [Brevifollis gellanilyticus]GEP41549.1 TetR family transcriptional regulator [Brevifollis gellanilyticus]